MPIISTAAGAVGPRPGSCTLTLCGPSRMSAIANLPSVPVTSVRFSLAVGWYTVTFAPATGSPAAVRTTPVQAGGDGALCCALSQTATISPNSKHLPVSRKDLRSFAKAVGSGSRLRLRKRSLSRANAGGYERYGARVRHSPWAILGTLLEATAALRQ